MTPLHLSIAIHYRACAGDYGRGNGYNNFEMPTVQEYIQHLVSAKLLRFRRVEEPGEAIYAGTEALPVYIDALLAVPFPVQKWVIPSQTHPSERE